MSVTTDLTWLQKHEKLLLGLLLTIVLLFSVNKVVNYMASKADKEATVSAQILSEQKTQNAFLTDQVNQDKAQNQVIQAQATAAILTLQGQIAQLRADLAKKQQADRTMPLTDVTRRISELAGFDPALINSVNNSVTMTGEAARQTAVTLENVPELKKELDNEKQVVVQQNNEISSLTKTVGDQGSLITGLNSQIVKADKACNDEITKVKDDARKSKVKIGVFGIISGIILKSFLHF
jgi:cell division protein FtsL